MWAWNKVWQFSIRTTQWHASLTDPTYQIQTIAWITSTANKDTCWHANYSKFHYIKSCLAFRCWSILRSCALPKRRITTNVTLIDLKFGSLSTSLLWTTKKRSHDLKLAHLNILNSLESSTCMKKYWRKIELQISFKIFSSITTSYYLTVIQVNPSNVRKVL